MTSTTLRTAAAATGAALVFTLTACGGGSGGDRGDGGTDKGSDDLPQGAIDAMFEELYGEGNAEQSNEDSMKVEELTAACMAEQGFQYTPVDWSQQGSMRASEGPEEEWGTLEFAKKWGYGATTNPWGGGEDVAPEDEFVDPNQAAVEAMSETEQTAYYEALYGPPPAEGEEGEMAEYNWETAGCSGSASHQVYEVDKGMIGEEFAALQEEMEVMWRSVEEDPRLAELHAEWASCMADAGYDGLAVPMDAENLIYDKTNAIYDEVFAAAPLDENSTEEDFQAQQDEIEARLAEITEEEITTAVADYTCREEVDLTRTQAEISVERQQEFYDDHKTELEAWRDAMAQAQG